MIEFIKFACTVIVGVGILSAVLYFVCSAIGAALARAKEPKLRDVIHIEGEQRENLSEIY